jgi:hypothetical protein
MRFWKKKPLSATPASCLTTALLEIPEVTPLQGRVSAITKPRLNLLLPSLDEKHVFGGIATALSFFKALAGNETELRIILTDQAQVPLLQSESWQDWKTLDCMQEDVTGKVILPMGDRWSRTFPVRNQDRFIATGWWTAYSLLRLLDWQASAFVKPKQAFVYLIQDFEPGFYPWSSRYVMALSTYQDPSPVIRVFNSQLLQAYFANYSLPNAQEYVFDPQLNSGLATARKQLIASGGVLQKEKILLLYGRPGTPRNGFELACQGIQHWASQDTCAADWQIISVGEQHAIIPLANGQHIRSLGKLNLEDYAALLRRSAMGLSLMFSPHPSYPPLEMAAFGVRVVTNTYANKDLSGLSSFIESLPIVTPESIGTRLMRVSVLTCVSEQIRLLSDTHNLFAPEQAPFPFIDALNSIWLNA